MLRRYLKKLLRPPAEPARFEPSPQTLDPPMDRHGTVAYRRLLTPNTLELGITLDSATFVPGQYLNVVLPEDKPGGQRREVRSYSIFSHPSEDGPIRLIARLIEGGRATTWLSGLSAGDPISVVLPLGTFHLRPPLHSKLFFVATGTGIVPIRSMICDLIETGAVARHDITLFWGLRSEDDLFGQEEYLRWASEHARFDVVITLSRAGQSWTGRRGRVTQALADKRVPNSDSQVYLCGNGAMVDAVIELLDRQGLPRGTGRIFCEKFFDSSSA